MRTDVPEFARCCFCFPLRYGLITWGYIRLAVSLYFFAGMSTSFYSHLYSTQMSDIAILSVLLLLVFIDIVLTTIFIIGGYKKNLNLLRAYYYYTIIICVLVGLMGTGYIVNALNSYRSESFAIDIWLFLYVATAWLAHIAMHVYVLLLMRSEICKLTNNSEFRFTNVVAEVKHTMQCAVEINGVDEME